MLTKRIAEGSEHAVREEDRYYDDFFGDDEWRKHLEPRLCAFLEQAGYDPARVPSGPSALPRDEISVDWPQPKSTLTPLVHIGGRR